jgi:tripartite-type tricarboxylate transporter receptor subunit TctC
MHSLDIVRRHRMIAAAAAFMCLALPAAHAQTYPDKPVRLVVGYAPGTAPDVLGRLLATRLGELLKQQVIVDNRAGAGGQIAAQNVAKSAPDGYSVLLGEVGSISIAPAAFSKLPYDPFKELVGVAEVGKVDFLLAVPATSPAQSVADFAKQNKGKTDKVNFATFGAGTSGHFGAELFGDAAGFKVEPVHYRATGDAVTALVAGDVAGAFVSTALGSAQVKGGKLRALATTAPQRSPLLPDVPTFTEAGYPKIDISAWFAVMAPTGTPAPVLDTLNRQVLAALQTPDLRQKIIEAGFSVSGTSRADTDRMLRSEGQRWAAIVKASGFKGD